MTAAMRGDPADGTTLLPTPKTWLNRIRRERAVVQSELASKTGISDRTLSRLENGEIANPPLRYLVNCALVLGVDWHELVEDEWETWIRLPGGPDAPERPRTNPKLQRLAQAPCRLESESPSAFSPPAWEPNSLPLTHRTYVRSVMHI